MPAILVQVNSYMRTSLFQVRNESWWRWNKHWLSSIT